MFLLLIVSKTLRNINFTKRLFACPSLMGVFRTLFGMYREILNLYVKLLLDTIFYQKSLEETLLSYLLITKYKKTIPSVPLD